MNKYTNLIVVLAVTLLVSGCASFTESLVAIPGTVVDATTSIGSSAWHFATDWITGDYVVTEVVTEVVVEEVTDVVNVVTESTLEVVSETTIAE
jgi:uncharacterized protein YceK